LRVKQGQLDAAAAAYDRAIAAYPARIEPLIERANLADMQGKLDQAIGLIGKAARLAPGIRACSISRSSSPAKRAIGTRCGNCWPRTRSISIRARPTG
jgi:tetratricopeptide (TPR) repeat protein